jgi:multimeric flavodoxin WrbA
MNILIINGSPKGEYSITLQTSFYLEAKNPNHTFRILDVGRSIRSHERDFSGAKEAIEWADALVFSYPVYTFIAPYQLHKFISLLKEANLDLSDKYATQITTSKHFYDVTAHKYVKENCSDLGLKFIDGLSADMEDLISKNGKAEADAFFAYLLWCIENGVYDAPKAQKANSIPTLPEKFDEVAKTDANVVIVTDCEGEGTPLWKMIESFRARLGKSSRVININEYPIKGGCLGCFGCAVSGECVYNDGFDKFLREEIQTSDSIIYAFKITDHSMGTRFKMYDDRQFCNGHRTVTVGMPVGYLIEGEISKEENLRMILEARAGVGGNFLAGIASTEADPDGEIENLVAKLNYALENKHTPPKNFWGVGGMKIFRDLIWLMQGMMKADHKFYKKHKQYDFPQKKRGTMLKMYLVGMLLSSKKIRANMGNKMNEGMIAPYKKVVEKAQKSK